MDNALERFEDFVRGEFEIDELREIAEYGCNHCGAHGFEFYDTVNRFWDDNIEFCEEAATELSYDVYDLDLVDFIKQISQPRDEFHNIKQNLVFALIEYCAHVISSEEDEEDE